MANATTVYLKRKQKKSMIIHFFSRKGINNMFENVEVNSIRWFNLDNLLNEEWKDVKGYEELYQISNYGRVKSLTTWNGNKYKKSYTKREKILNLL